MAQAVAPNINFPDLRGYRLNELILATTTIIATIAWCRLHGLLAIRMICDSIGCQGNNREMREVTDKRADGVKWKCSKKIIFKIN